MTMFGIYLLGVLVAYLFGIANAYRRRKEIDDVVELSMWLVNVALISWIGLAIFFTIFVLYTDKKNNYETETPIN